jgi:hypothetical protein
MSYIASEERIQELFDLHRSVTEEQEYKLGELAVSYFVLAPVEAHGTCPQIHAVFSLDQYNSPEATPFISISSNTPEHLQGLYALHTRIANTDPTFEHDPLYYASSAAMILDHLFRDNQLPLSVDYAQHVVDSLDDQRRRSNLVLDASRESTVVKMQNWVNTWKNT